MSLFSNGMSPFSNEMSLFSNGMSPPEFFYPLNKGKFRGFFYYIVLYCFSDVFIGEDEALKIINSIQNILLSHEISLFPHRISLFSHEISRFYLMLKHL
jgi:hypothetical protein